MREGTAPIVKRGDYAAPAFWIRSVELAFDLDPAKTIVASKMEIERNAQAAPGQALRLDGEGLTLLRVQADGQSVSFRHDDGNLVIDSPPDKDRFTLEIRNTCAPDKNTELSGLYTSGGGFFTQCEAQGFRRITYYLDRPDVMASYTVTLRADKQRYPVLLSNGNLIEQADLANGRHMARWHDPFPKPSYLFALVAAELSCREQRIRSRGGRDHLLQVYVRRADMDKTEHAMNSLVASVAWDEARFGLGLDLDRFMIVAVSDFNMGAMENKGLNIFNSKYVLASPASATDEDFADIESVIGHEYFHNWTGNRVTCRDWFQLSLKEGLTVYRDQEFSMDMAASASARAVKRINDVRSLRESQFPEDAGPMAHPVRPEAYAAIDNFYTATVYEKGAEVVRMMASLVGRDGFRAGMDLYFKRHDGQAVSCDDFAQAIGDANPASLLAQHLDGFKRWYSQAGTPRLTARGQFDAAARSYTLHFSQSVAGAPCAMVMPVAVGLLAADGSAVPLRLQGEATVCGLDRLLVLSQAEQSLTFVDLDSEPVPSLLRRFSAPVLLDDGLQPSALRHLLSHDSDPFNRWEAGQRLMLQALLQALAQPLTDAPGPVLDEALLASLAQVLNDDGLAPAFKELVLTLPSEQALAEQVDQVVPPRIHAVRERALDELAAHLRNHWDQAWVRHQVREGYRPSAEQAGQRALANLALKMRVRLAQHEGDAVWPGRAYQRFKDASSMTDRLGALEALVDARSPLVEVALQRFHALFKDDALALDKWFKIQATAPEVVGDGGGAVFTRVKALLQHADFSLRNPNRARSLISAFCMGNPAAFHRVDAAGYVFWADRVVEVDAFNPQLAARLARTMDRWSHLAEPWRGAAREALTRIAARAELSDDVREIIGKALASG